MRLYLSSQRVGSTPEELVKLFTSRTRIALIANGAYLDDLAKQRDRVDSELAELRGIGLDPAELDLRDYFGQPRGSAPISNSSPACGYWAATSWCSARRSAKAGLMKSSASGLPTTHSSTPATALEPASSVPGTRYWMSCSSGCRATPMSWSRPAWTSCRSHLAALRRRSRCGRRDPGDRLLHRPPHTVHRPPRRSSDRDQRRQHACRLTQFTPT